jgi:hypothetical protein
MQTRRALLAVVAAIVLGLGLGAAAVAAAPRAGGQHHKAGHSHHGGHDHRGDRHSISDDEISIQLWNFAAYVGFGTDAATQARAEEVLRRLSEIGYRNVEPFTFNGRTAAQLKALLDRYDLKAPSRHGDVSITNFAQTLADSRTCARSTWGRAASRRRASAATRTRWRPRS